MSEAPPFVEIVPSVHRFRDTCNVYVLQSGREAAVVDFGSGAVLDHVATLGIDRVTDVLVTHHHRDQVQGLARAVEAGARIWAPPVEKDLITGIDRHWLRRPIDNDYELRQDRFSLLEPVPITGTVAEYRTVPYGNFEIYALPTPGHTVGSVSYFVEVDGRRLAFVGDLLYGEGKVWSLAAMQWTYTGVEGEAAAIVSFMAVDDQEADVLLPSHGDRVDDPAAAIALARARLQEIVDLRRGRPWDLEDWFRRPWAQVTPHLLRNRTSLATSWALLSEAGKALILDYGYDMTTGLVTASDRAARRPLLASIAALHREYGVDQVEVVIPTHYHDDHVAGFNLLREVVGTEVWCPENVTPVLEDPWRHDLPCLWYDPIPVDRSLANAAPVTWREYEITAYALPGHTLYAGAILFEVDGHRVLATGDQQAGGEGDSSRAILNYQYRNRFRYDDFTRSAELYLSLKPDLIISGHTSVQEVDDDYLDQLLEDGRRLARLHRDLLPVDEVDFGAGGFAARIEPYRSTIAAGETLELEVRVRNPFEAADVAVVQIVVPDHWSAEPLEQEVRLPGHAEATLRFAVSPNGAPSVSRARVAADVSVGGVPFGQQAEALVNVE